MEHSQGFLKLVNLERPHVKEITVEEARERLAKNPKAVLLDVREDNEWTKGHAVQAIHLGKGILERDLEKTFPEPDRELIMYCGGGFRSVLSLRAANEGIDLARERAKVESAKMRYFNIPVVSSAPRPEQADEFLRLTREKANHPMLINCASANRVGAFMMILRVVDQGWSEDKALDEAIKIGLSSDGLKKFATDYIANQKSRHQQN